MSDCSNLNERHSDHEARQFSKKFISLYRDHLALWNRSSDGYSNKYMRRKALKELTLALQEFKPGFTERMVRAKINTMRTNFNKEFRKREKMRLMGHDLDPPPWYYDSMMFLKDESCQAKPASVTSEGGLYVIKNVAGRKRSKLEYDQESVTNKLLNGHPQSLTEDSESKIDTSDEVDIISNCSYPTEAQPEVTYGDDPLITHNKLNIYQTVTEYDAVGINVAKKLAKMDPEQAIYAESIINNVLRKGLQLKLTDDTNLCDIGCNQLKFTLDNRILINKHSE